MATTYKTPGVYINEISTLPASVAQVETAIPAFIGFTEIATDVDGSTLKDVPKRIRSMVEFEQFFGGQGDAVGSFGDGTSTKIKVVLDDANDYVLDSLDIKMKYLLYDSMRVYFANGGGPCYIVSVGGYDFTRTDATIVTDIKDGLDRIATEDEPTILLAPDAASLQDASDLGEIQKYMLAQCNKLKDRFSVLDLIETASTNDVGEGDFRDDVGMLYLKYGAAYGPWLETSYKFNARLDKFTIEKKSAPGINDPSMFDATSVSNISDALGDLAAIEAQAGTDYFTVAGSTTHAHINARFGKLALAISDMRGLMSTMNDADVEAGVAINVDVNSTLATIAKKARAYVEGYNNFYPTEVTEFGDNDFDGTLLGTPIGGQSNYDYKLDDAGITMIKSIYVGSTIADRVASSVPFINQMINDVLSIYDAIIAEANRVVGMVEDAFVLVDPIYASVKRAVDARGIVIPPSGAVVGVYAATDENRGVWKAPANVSLANVIKPTIKIDNQTQESLNVDTSGKSVNIIRSFTGKGVLIWGARTLAGNDNEWRYVPVRRLFITMEESIKKASEFVVFEPNDRNTWLRAKAMIENYLTGLWRQGALAGAKPADAFFVNVGLGETMTSDDILNGKMIIEIGVAAVRPAEFIILRFSHKLQES